MSSSAGPRNRLAKPLPKEWREELIRQGVPKRKYIAVCRVRLRDGRVIDPVIIEQGWIVSASHGRLAGEFEERIDFDPRAIAELDVVRAA